MNGNFTRRYFCVEKSVISFFEIKKRLSEDYWPVFVEFCIDCHNFLPHDKNGIFSVNINRFSFSIDEFWILFSSFDNILHDNQLFYWAWERIICTQSFKGQIFVKKCQKFVGFGYNCGQNDNTLGRLTTPFRFVI